MIKKIKSTLRPLWRQAYPYYERACINFRTFDLPINKLLRGGENGIRAAKHAEITNNFLRPSTPITKSPQIKLLQQYEKIGDQIFEELIFQNTDYYKNALETIRFTGSYFYDRPDKIKILAKRFIAQHKGEHFNLPQQPGQSNSKNSVWVRPIKASSYYEVIDGNHRIARAFMRGESTVKAIIYEKEPTYTPLQQLLLDSLWINKQKWLYQPIESPELEDEWVLVRNSKDRLTMMQKFLENHIGYQSYLDIASSYGWFVNEFSKLGFDAYGMERDPAGIEVGIKVYGVRPEQIMHTDIVVGLKSLVKQNKTYDVVSFLSILHHFVLGKSSTSAEDLIKLVDKVTGKVLFIDTGENHEVAFEGDLRDWSPGFIKDWLLKHTFFNEVIPLGVDSDCKPPFEGYYSRTLFACIR